MCQTLWRGKEMDFPIVYLAARVKRRERFVESVESFDRKVELNFSFQHYSILDINVWRIRSILGVIVSNP